jgi:hypothetical protein
MNRLLMRFDCDRFDLYNQYLVIRCEWPISEGYVSWIRFLCSKKLKFFTSFLLANHACLFDMALVSWICDDDNERINRRIKLDKYICPWYIMCRHRKMSIDATIILDHAKRLPTHQKQWCYNNKSFEHFDFIARQVVLARNTGHFEMPDIFDVLLRVKKRQNIEHDNRKHWQIVNN